MLSVPLPDTVNILLVTLCRNTAVYCLFLLVRPLTSWADDYDVIYTVPILMLSVIIPHIKQANSLAIAATATFPALEIPVLFV